MKAKGFTLIEMMIGLAILGIITVTVVEVIGGNTTCINGYVFAKSYAGKYGGSNLTQILDDQGHGIKCEVK